MNRWQRMAVRALGLQSLIGENVVGVGTKVGSGVDIVAGQFEYETSPAVRGIQRWATYDLMEADARVKAALRANILPLITADWEFRPGDDADSRAEEFADLCNANLLGIPNERFGEEYSIQTPFKAQRLGEIVRCFRDGYAVFVSTPKIVDGDAGLRKVYDRLQWIEPESMTRTGVPWDTDKQDNILGIRRMYLNPEGEYVQEYIPAKRLKLYVWELLGGRFEGRSGMRSMYGAWFRKDFKQKRELLWAQKVGAPSPMGHYPASANWSDSQVEEFIRFVRSSRGEDADKAYFVGPMDKEGNKAEVTYAGAEHDQLDRLAKCIDQENREILSVAASKTSGMAEGSQSSGNRALGEIISRREFLEIESLAEVILTWMFKGVANLRGEVEELRDWNYEGMTTLPELVVTRVDPFAEMRGVKDFIEAWKAGIVPHHPEIRKQFVENHGYQLPEEAYDVEEEPAVAPGAPPGGANGGPRAQAPEGDPKPGDAEPADPNTDGDDPTRNQPDSVAAQARGGEGSAQRPFAASQRSSNGRSSPSTRSGKTRRRAWPRLQRYVARRTER